MAEPVRVGALLGSVPGLAPHLGEARLLAAWPQLAGPAAPRSRADRVEGGILHVLVESSGWLHRLTLEEPVLLAGCRRVAELRGIRFHLAPVGGLAPAGEPARAPRPIPPAEAAAIDAALTPIRAHPTVAEAFRRAMTADRMRHAEGERP